MSGTILTPREVAAAESRTRSALSAIRTDAQERRAVLEGRITPREIMRRAHIAARHVFGGARKDAESRLDCAADLVMVALEHLAGGESARADDSRQTVEVYIGRAMNYRRDAAKRDARERADSETVEASEQRAADDTDADRYTLKIGAKYPPRAAAQVAAAITDRLAKDAPNGAREQVARYFYRLARDVPNAAAAAELSVTLATLEQSQTRARKYLRGAYPTAADMLAALTDCAPIILAADTWTVARTATAREAWRADGELSTGYLFTLGDDSREARKRRARTLAIDWGYSRADVAADVETRKLPGGRRRTLTRREKLRAKRDAHTPLVGRALKREAARLHALTLAAVGTPNAAALKRDAERNAEIERERAERERAAAVLRAQGTRRAVAATRPSMSAGMRYLLGVRETGAKYTPPPRFRTLSEQLSHAPTVYAPPTGMRAARLAAIPARNVYAKLPAHAPLTIAADSDSDRAKRERAAKRARLARARARAAADAAAER
jgi:hypothetical protein